mmetsp:Transcript_31713/g.56945  ORF Transcript_31713/g.56945 Transcript_31713/m.56945 type:complete len:405 (-) Transcript_31713:247-1461(-)
MRVLLAASLLQIVCLLITATHTLSAPLPDACVTVPRLGDALQRYLQQPKQGVLSYHCRIPCGGLGDRLKGIATTFLLAVLTAKQFHIHFHEGPPLQTFLRPGPYVNWSLPHTHPSKVLWYNAFPRPSPKQLRAADGDWTVYLRTLFRKDTGLKTNRDFIPYLLKTPLRAALGTMGIDGAQCADMSCPFRCFWHLLFAGPAPALQHPYPLAHPPHGARPCGTPPRPTALPRLQSVGGLPPRAYWGLHVRMGGSAVRWASDVVRIQPDTLRTLLRATQAIMTQAGGSDLVYLATDSPLAHNASALLPGCVYWFDGVIAHTDKSRQQAVVSGSTKVWLDWFALSHAAAVIAAPSVRPSGFVQTAVWLSRANSTYLNVQEDGLVVSRRLYDGPGGWSTFTEVRGLPSP